MKKEVESLLATANADRFKTPSKNETLPQSDFLMLIECIGETEHELLTKLAKGIETMIAADSARNGECASLHRIDFCFGFFACRDRVIHCRTVMQSSLSAHRDTPTGSSS
jgi:hypothetical protein